MNLDIPASEIKVRLKKWKQPKPRYTRGVLAKYAAQVNSAHLGAVTDAGL
jgi:dihydroxy-acid dehydratase